MRAGSRRRVVMVFVDGLGLGSADPAVNPLQPDVCPHLAGLLRTAKPIDACLGIEGLPQSATGQTALLTGVNAAQLVGRHVEGFPGRALVEVIEKHSIFRVLREAGLASTFANGYFVNDVDEARAARIKSVTTVATLSGLGTVRNRFHLERNEAVCQDLTREKLRERGYDGPLVAPEEAAAHLLGVARQHHFTLFEYFQTDRAGHKADFDAACGVLRTFDVFLGCLLDGVEATQDVGLVLTSDHGNIEDMSVRVHTRNPVPLVTVGPGAEAIRAQVEDLTEVAGAIVEYLRGKGRQDDL